MSVAIPMVDIPAGATRILGSLTANEQPLPLQGVQIQARVIDRVAEVTVEQKFGNPFTEAIEAVYVFPLSGGSAVSRFEAQIGKRIVRGRIEERAKARREYAASGIRFDLRMVEGAYLRTQGYSEIPSNFLAGKMINLFVTDTLGYDIDRDRTGGCSMGPRPPAPKIGGDRYFKTFLGLREASEATLEHEYAHHFTLDTLERPTAAANLWADLRNDYWLWRQRHGVPILEFRRCANAESPARGSRSSASEY